MMAPTESKMNASLTGILSAIAAQPQRQDGTDAQLRDLRVFANKLGLYDAADFLCIAISRADQSQAAAKPVAGPGMPDSLNRILATIPPQPQRQDGTDAQLRDLRAFAYKLGLHDASDYIGQGLERKPAPAVPISEAS